MSSLLNSESIFGRAITEHLGAVRKVEARQPALEVITLAMTATLRAGGKVLRCGNGGIAGDSQHLTSEIVGRFRRERRGLASMALTTDTSLMTSVANDYGFKAVFESRIEALGNLVDLLMGISTSGNSRKMIAALEAARIRENHILTGHMLCDWIELDCVQTHPASAKAAAVQSEVLR